MARDAGEGPTNWRSQLRRVATAEVEEDDLVEGINSDIKHSETGECGSVITYELDEAVNKLEQGSNVQYSQVKQDLNGDHLKPEVALGSTPRGSDTQQIEFEVSRHGDIATAIAPQNNTEDEKGYGHVTEESSTRSRDFSALRSMFTAEKRQQDSPSLRNSTSPELDITPVKEKQSGLKAKRLFSNDNKYERSNGTEGNTDFIQRTSAVGHMFRHFETVSDRGLVRKKPVAFNVDIQRDSSGVYSRLSATQPMREGVEKGVDNYVKESRLDILSGEGGSSSFGGGSEIVTGIVPAGESKIVSRFVNNEKETEPAEQTTVRNVAFDISFWEHSDESAQRTARTISPILKSKFSSTRSVETKIDSPSKRQLISDSKVSESIAREKKDGVQSGMQETTHSLSETSQNCVLNMNYLENSKDQPKSCSGFFPGVEKPWKKDGIVHISKFADADRIDNSRKGIYFDIGFEDESLKGRMSKTSAEFPNKALFNEDLASQSSTKPIASDFSFREDLKKTERPGEHGEENPLFKDEIRSPEKRSLAFSVSFDDDSLVKVRKSDSKEHSRTDSSPAKLSNGYNLEDKQQSFENAFSSAIKPSKLDSLVHERTVTRNDETSESSAESAEPLAFDIVFDQDSPASITLPRHKTKSPVTLREPGISKTTTGDLLSSLETSQGISFDICFDEEPSGKSPKVNRKPKLTPRNIRLKKIKPGVPIKGPPCTEEALPIKSESENFEVSSEQVRFTDAQAKAAISDVPPSVATDTRTALGQSSKPASRDTYSLDEVSNSLQVASEQGLTLEQALDSLANQQEVSNVVGDTASTPKRGTYSLDDVSNCLLAAADKGLTVAETLENLAQSEEIVKVKEISATSRDDTRTGPSKEMAVESLELKKGTSQFVTSDEVTRDARLKGRSKKRGTYTLDDVCKSFEKGGVPLEEALQQLLDEVESAIGTTNQSRVEPAANRGTYDLKDVSVTVEEASAEGIPVLKALDQIATADEAISNDQKGVGRGIASPGKRGTHDLEDVAKFIQDTNARDGPVLETLKQVTTPEKPPTHTLLEPQTCTSTSAVSSISNVITTASKETYSCPPEGKRETYTLDDVSEHLAVASGEGCSMVDALDKMSKSELRTSPQRRRPHKFFTKNREEAPSLEQPLERKPDTESRRTYTLDQVAHSLEMAQCNGIPVVEALSSISRLQASKSGTSTEEGVPGSRGTYSLDEVAQSLETARKKGLPVIIALENLVLQGGGSVKGPAEVALHRRQGKLMNRKTYALASPLETIGENRQLRLFDGTSRKLLPVAQDSNKKGKTKVQKVNKPGQGVQSELPVVQTLDFLTSACEVLLQSTAESAERDRPAVSPWSSIPRSPSKTKQEAGSPKRTDGHVASLGNQKEQSTRGTYSLDDISLSLEGAQEKGIPVVAALGALASTPCVRKDRGGRTMKMSNSKSESNLADTDSKKTENTRQTYSLVDLSSSMDDAKAKGIPVIAALDELTDSLARFFASRSEAEGKKTEILRRQPDRPSIRRKEASRKVKSEYEKELPKISPFPLSYPPAMQTSFSLDDVASALERSFEKGVPFQDVLATMESEESTIQQASVDSPSSISGDSPISSRGDSPSLPRTSSPLVGHGTSPFSVSGDSLSLNSLMYTSSDSWSLESVTSPSPSETTEKASSREALTPPKEDIQLPRGKISPKGHTKRSSGPFQLTSRGRKGSAEKDASNLSSPGNLRKQRVAIVSSSGSPVESSLWATSPDTSSSASTKRGTYDLKDVSRQLDSSQSEDHALEEALKELAKSRSTDETTSQVSDSRETQFSDVKPRRGTYSLEDISKQLGGSGTEESAVVKALDEISRTLSSPNISSSIESSDVPTSLDKRGTYSLEDVSYRLDFCQSQGKSMKETKRTISTDNAMSSEASKKESSPKRATYSLEDLGTKLDTSVIEGVTLIQALEQVSSKTAVSSYSDTGEGGTRRTYSLDQVGGSIDDATQRGVPVLYEMDKLSKVDDPERDDPMPLTLQNTAGSKEPPASPIPKRKPLPKGANKDDFFIEYFPTKADTGATQFRMSQREASKGPDKGIAVVHSIEAISQQSALLNEHVSRKGTTPASCTSSHSDPIYCDKKSTEIANMERESHEKATSEGLRSDKGNTLHQFSVQNLMEEEHLKSELADNNLGKENNKATEIREHEVSLTLTESGDFAIRQEKEKKIDRITELDNSRTEPDKHMPQSNFEQLSLQERELNLCNLDSNRYFSEVNQEGSQLGLKLIEGSCQRSNNDVSLVSQLNDDQQYSRKTTELTLDFESHATQARSPKTRSTWRAGGSVVEALESYQQSRESNDDVLKLDSGLSELTDDSSGINQDEIESVVTRDTPPKPRSTWRPSGSVVDQILTLMDSAEDSGLTIVDVLDQAAELAEFQGEIDESQVDEPEDEKATNRHLALLRMQFEEKRRHIESEKRRNQEQWEEERRTLGQTAFWYMIGRSQGGENESENNQPGNEGSAGATSTPLNIPNVKERQRATNNVESASPSQASPPVGMSTPVESMSPRTGYQVSNQMSGYQSPTVETGYQAPSFGHGYRDTAPHKPGHQSPVTHQPGYQSPAQPSGYQSPVSHHTGFQFPQSYQPDYMSRVTSENGHQAGVPQVQQQDFETREFRLSDYPPNTRPTVQKASSQLGTQESGPSRSPVGPRKCWNVSPAVPSSPPAFVPPSSVDEAGPIGRGKEMEESVGPAANEIEVDTELIQKRPFAMFISEDAKTGGIEHKSLTPEQQKGRDKFMRSRQKKQEEEKARKDAEIEKKRRREERLRDTEAQIKIEENKRRREEEDLKRGKLHRERLARGTDTTPVQDGYSTFRTGSGNYPSNKEDHSAFAEFSGPQCYVKPSGKSNRKLVVNAISYVCLSGAVNKDAKERCLQAISESNGYNFMVLFKDGLKFRGLYSYNSENDQLYKIFGIGPRVISPKMIENVYKYSSGGKEFYKIPSKTLSISVDGISILKQYWQSSKPPVQSKTMSNLKRPPRPPQR